jgi:uncharacterized membrane protein
MLLSCVLDIPYPLSLNVKLHKKNIELSSTFIRIWPHIFIEIKNNNYYKFVDMNIMALQNPIIQTLRNCSKIMVASIHYLLG